MGLYATTALGRMVRTQEPGTIREDEILRALYVYWESPFNPKNAAISQAHLANVVGMEPKLVEACVGTLVAKGYAEGSGGVEPSYRISPAGVLFVQNLAQGLGSIVR